MDYNTIKLFFKEIKSARKGALMIVFLFCLCLAFFDLFCLRPLGVYSSLLFEISLTVSLVSLLVWLIKIFNSFMDKRELFEAYKQRINKVLSDVRPILDNLEEEEKLLLKEFTLKDNTTIVIKCAEQHVNYIRSVANKINSKLQSYGIKLTCSFVTPLIIKTSYDTLDLLKQYFSEGL